MKAVLLSLLTGSALVIMFSTSFCQEAKEKSWENKIISENEKERQEGRKAVVHLYNSTIKKLVEILNRPVEKSEPFYSSSTARNIAIILLGDLRAKDSVNALLEWVLPKPGQSLVVSSPMSYGFAGCSLVRIGLPAVPSLLEKIEEEGASKLGKECVKVLKDIKGKEEVILFLKAQIGEEKENEVRKNLEAAIAYLESLK